MSDPTLPRRAVACPGWRWLAGIRAFDAGGRRFRVLAMHPGGGALATLGDIGFSAVPMSPEAMAMCIPDLADPCTLGALLAAYDERRPTKTCPDPVYTAAAVYGLMSRETAAALVAALEAP